MGRRVALLVIVLALATPFTAPSVRAQSPDPKAGGSRAGAGAATLVGATISSSGPLTQITISPDLNCAVNYEGDTYGEFYDDTACATLIAANGTLYRPADIPAGDSASPFVAFTPVGQTTSSPGEAGDPWRITTVVDAGASGLRITEIDTYLPGQSSYYTDVRIENTGGTTVAGVIYRAADCYLYDSDYGFGRAESSDPFSDSSIACVSGLESPDGATVEGGRIEEWTPSTQGSAGGGGHHEFVISARRSVNITPQYRARVAILPDQRIELKLQRADPTQVDLAPAVIVPAIHDVDDFYWLRFQVTGTTQPLLKAKLWTQGTPEPDWQVTYTDTAAPPLLQGPGGIGLQTTVFDDLYTGTWPVHTYVDDVCAVSPGQTCALAPHADFLVDATTGTANVTAFAFTDTSHPDATSWAWDFGDGTTSTQQHPTHTYAAAGTYTVQLTAANAAGSDTRTRTGLIEVAPQLVTISKAFSFASGLDGWTSSGTNCTGQYSSDRWTSIARCNSSRCWSIRRARSRKRTPC